MIIVFPTSGNKKLSYNNLLDLDAAIKISFGIKTKIIFAVL